MTRTRGIGIAGVVTALLALAGLASRTRPLASRGSMSSHTTHIVAAIALALVIALVVFIAIESRRPGSTARRTFGVGDVVLVLLVIAALTAGSFGIGGVFHPSGSSEERGVKCSAYEKAHGRAISNCDGQTAPVAKQTRQASKRRGDPSWLGVEAILALLLGGGGLLVFDRRNRLARATGADANRRGVIVDALDLSIDDLRLEPDARRAIIAAYARMERAFLAAGLPKQPAEAPHEFLIRSLRELDTRVDAASRLTELFELAKFSDHQLDLGMRDEAIDALTLLRHELAESEKTTTRSSEAGGSSAARFGSRSETSV